jgi:predicted lipoprotein with Yx(FWY)xxD motif
VRNRILPLAATLVAALALSACGLVGGGGAPAGGTPAPAPPAAAPTEPAGPQPALVAEEIDDLGTVVVDQDGYTLYRFDEDTADPPTTTCVDACADKWPPFVVDRAAKLRVDGVEDSAVGLVARPDGSTQLTIGGWAVYRYTGDTAPGATEGQGMGGSWYAITPAGRKATPV